ncbi:MAG: GHKL domain-containing protein [Lachnospiraceae bacterium]|nr:GHKL domain-containing protein [Lachnospiraceae bacterium]
MNLIKKYWENVHLYVLLLTYGNCLCAGIFYTCCKLYGNYPDISWNKVLFFDASQLFYLGISIILILKNQRDASFFPSHFGQIKAFVTVTLFIQYNLVLFLFPSSHVWSCTFLFLAIVVFYLDVKLLIFHYIGYMAFLSIAFVRNPNIFWSDIMKSRDLEPLYFHMIILLLTFICMFAVTYFVQRFLIQAQMDEYENAYLLEKQLEYYQHMELLDKQLRSFRHDIRNHFSVMQYLVEQKQLDDLEQYFGQLNSSFSFQESIYFSGNIIIDSILNCELAHSLGDTASVRVYGTLPKITTVTSMDLCTLFSNLLSNAIKAVTHSGIPDAVLSIGFETGSTYFSIIIRNHTSQKQLPSKLSAEKAVNRDHGFGMGKIRAVCDKYEGIFEQSLEEQIMTTRVYLPI